MLLRKVILENYGLYGGLHEFDLVPRTKYGRRRSIILFGGKNGAGKTTLLDAIRLTLYGKKSLGPGTSTKAYLELLRDRIHRPHSDLLAPTFARVCIEFDFVSAGERKVYYVERAWSKANSDRIDETFKIYRDGSLLEDIEAAQSESFIADIVPERLSQLFFFDGEKIKRMADDVSGTSAAKEAIQSLLGLDIVDRLVADLSLYRSRETKTLASDLDSQKIDQVSTRSLTLAHEEDELAARIHETKAELKTLLVKTNQSENRLREQGGAFAEAREQQQTDRARAEADIESAVKALQIEAAGLFPLSLCPNVSEALIKQLDAESCVKQARLTKGVIDDLDSVFDKMLATSKKMDNVDTKEAQRLFRKATKIVIQKHSDISLIHDVSDASAAHLRGLFFSAQKTGPTRVRQLADCLEDANRRLLLAKQGETRAPDDEAIQPYMAELKKLLVEKGKLEATISALADELATLHHKRSQTDRERERIEEKIRTNASATDRFALVSRAQIALRAYQKRLIEEKLQVLEKTVTDCFNLLSRKEDIVQNIRIHPTTFEVELEDRRGRTIPKKQLSSGEKQIYAISLLWGLARTSARPLPVIIDTPLGRLDSDHRRNLIERYFPYAGHQVILLSTDTEVDQGFFKMLSPEVSHCYHLIYENADGRTVPREGYFWKESASA